MIVNQNRIIKNTKQFLNNLKSELEFINIIEFQNISFNSSEFRTADILNSQIKRIENNKLPLIYSIELKQKEKLATLLNNFEKFSLLNKQRTKNIDRVNVSKYNKTKSNYLYVGSSTTDFRSRIKNHFGTRGNRVYSLHLCKWDRDLDYDIILKTYQVTNSKKTQTDRILVEFLEQQLWDDLKPNFGKRSGQ